MKPVEQENLGYYSRRREDILDLVSPTVRRVLSVGCGSGVTEAELIQRGAEVVGIELDPVAAKAAEQKGLRVLQGDAAAVSAALREECFDCLIYADVLEHLPDPLALLSAHVQHLQGGGQVIVSVPNFRNYKVFWNLFVKGRIPSWDEGIFDRTHLRITTRKLVLDWFDACGLEPTHFLSPIYGRRDRLISAGLLGLAREFIAVQVILAGIKK